MVWGLFRTKKVKPAAGKTGYWRTVWRRVRDSNPRSLSGHSISSAAPSTTRTTLQGLSQHQNYLGKRGELMGRTSKNIKLKIPEKPRKIKGFRNGGYRIATTISSAAPSTTRTTLQGLSQHQNYLGKRGELMGRTSKNIKLKIPEKPRKIKGFRNGGYRIATTISSQSRYDHFDTSPYLGESFRITILL